MHEVLTNSNGWHFFRCPLCYAMYHTPQAADDHYTSCHQATMISERRKIRKAANDYCAIYGLDDEFGEALYRNWCKQLGVR